MSPNEGNLLKEANTSPSTNVTKLSGSGLTLKKKVQNGAAVVPGTGSLAESLKDRLWRNLYDCMICFDKIAHRDRIWSCEVCWAVFHIKCVKQWASSSVTGSWRCPGCQANSTSIPSRYTCYCKKVKEPKSTRNPHGCDSLCGKPRGCIHPCIDKCHPGPCADCDEMGIPKPCACGNGTLALKCTEMRAINFVPSCGTRCRRTLDCV